MGLRHRLVFRSRATRLRFAGDARCRLRELSYVGAISYFEAFCKDLFGALINLHPDLLDNLRKAKLDILVDPTDILRSQDHMLIRVGFLVAERMNFGTAQKINANYFSLLGTTPLSKPEVDFFDGALRERNLLVHHGGVFTLSYIKQSRNLTLQQLNSAFLDSKTLEHDELFQLLDFIESLARKIASSSRGALEERLKAAKIPLSKSVASALWFVDGGFD